MNQPPLLSLGLGGDGDEIEAIDAVESKLGFRLDYADAPQWRSVGDVFDSVMRQRPELAASTTWIKVRVALARATGYDPRRVARETALINQTSIWQQLGALAMRISGKHKHA